MSGARLIAETNTSLVYRVVHDNVSAVLKLLNERGETDERNGAAALAHFDGHGAARLTRHDECAVLMEDAGAEILKTLVEGGQDIRATEIIAGVLNDLHGQAAKETTKMFTPLHVWFRALFKNENANAFYKKAAAAARELLEAPVECRVLHGDIHHENILHGQRGWLAIDPKGLFGERTFDAANTLCNPLGMEQLVLNENRLLQNVDILARVARLDRQRLLKFTFAYSALSACWSEEDGQDGRAAHRIGEIVSAHV